MVTRLRVGRMYPNPIIFIQGHFDFFILHRQHPAYSLWPSSSSSRHRTYRRFLGAGVVPSLRSRRCTRIFRLAIATNITFSRPGVMVALVLKPNSSLNDSMAVTWLSPGSTSRCTSLPILWQSALVSGGTSNDAPFTFSWSLAKVRSFRIYRQTSYGTSGIASSISPPKAPKTSSTGMFTATWA